MKLDILAIAVHPDDAELSCSGTLLRHIHMGHKIGLLDLTRGELGTRGSAHIRNQEATAAAKLMGASVRESLAMPDGFFTHKRENLLQIIQIVRKYQPNIVLANALEDRHPDHARAAKLTADACFLAGLRRVETHEDSQLQASWRPKALYHYIQDQQLTPDFVVDVTPYVEQKMAIIRTFKSQFYDPESKEPDSPISSKAFLDSIIAKMRIFGRPIGVEFAEGFHTSRTMGVQDLFHLQ